MIIRLPFYFVKAIKTRMYLIKKWCLITFMGPSFPLSEMTLSCNAFPHVSKMPTLKYN